MGNRTTMVSRAQHHRLIRRSAGVALVIWAGLFYAVGLPNGLGSDLGSSDSGNPSAFSFQPSAFPQCLVCGDCGHSTPVRSFHSCSSNAAFEKMGTLPTEQRIEDPRMEVDSLFLPSWLLISEAMNLTINF